jgi:hypothetical protein
MSESISSQRRLHLLLELFEQIMDGALKPLADPKAQPECFFEGYRVLGVDGTLWSVGNTPTMIAQLPKVASRRLGASLARLKLVSVVELGNHGPVAAVAAPFRESEQVLAGKLWVRIPEHSLIIGDEFFGVPRTLLQATQAVHDRTISFLAEVRDNIKCQVLERLSDGSARIEVPVRENPRSIEQLRIREIRAIGRVLNRKRFSVRLWTTLSDPQRYPAETVARRYAERWRPELHSRELALDARTAPIRAGLTMETALQEAAAVLLASAVLAQMRIEALQRHEIPPSRMSFLELMRATKTLWDTLEMMGATLTAPQRQHVLERYFDAVRQAVGRPERRARYPTSAITRRVTPREREPTQHSAAGDLQIEVVRI